LLDVEFLLQKPSFAGTLIYVYRTGALRPMVKEHLRQRAEEQGLALSSIAPGSDLLPSVAMFPTFGVCDWSDPDVRKRKSNPLQIAATFPEENIAHLVPAQSYLQWAARQSVVNGCLTIQEPEITRQTIEPVLRYLELTTDLGVPMSLLDQSGYLGSFHDLVRSGSTIVDVMKRFDVLVLTQTDPETGKFKLDSGERDTRGTGRRTSLHKRTESFVFRRDPRSFAELVQQAAFLQSARGWNAARLLRGLYDASQAALQRWTTGRNLTNAERRRLAAAHGIEVEAMIRHAIVWTALLFAWEPRLLDEDRRNSIGYRPSSPVLIPILHLLLSNFLERTSTCDEGDPLAELWQDIEAATLRLARPTISTLDRARQSAAVSLAAEASRSSTTGRTWLVRLHQRIQDALSEAERVARAEEVNHLEGLAA
jgi:hypothetical protein